MSVEKDLIDYVIRHEITSEGYERIREYCEKQPPHSLILYRGHHEDSKVINKSPWYSATKTKEVARNQFASKDCCVFKIHLVEVPVIHINSIIGDKIGERMKEDEYIFLGDGSFYKNESLTEKGFTDKGKGNYECWYKIESKSQFNLQRILNTIPEEEDDLIHGPANIIGLGLTNNQKALVFEEIAKRKQKGGTSRMPKPQELLAKARSDMESAKDIESINKAIEQFRSLFIIYDRKKNYEKMAECYDEAGNGYMIIAELCKKTPEHFECYNLSILYTKAALRFSESARLYKLAKKYEKSAEVLDKLAESYGKIAEILRNTENTSNDPDIKKEARNALKRAMEASTEAFEMKKHKENMWHPNFRGFLGASPENSPKAKSKSRSKSKTPNSPKSKRKTRRS